MNISFVKFLIRNETKALGRDLLLILGMLVLLIPLYYWEKGIYFTLIGIFAAVYPALSGEYPGHLVPHDFSWKYYHMVVPDRVGFLLACCLSTLIKGVLIAGAMLTLAYFKIDDFNDVWEFVFIYFSAIIFLRLMIFRVSLDKMRKIYIHYPNGNTLWSAVRPYMVQFHKLFYYLAMILASIYCFVYLGKVLPDYVLFIFYIFWWIVVILLFRGIIASWKDERLNVLSHRKMLPYTLVGICLATFLSYKLEYWQFPGHFSNKELVKNGNIEILKTRDIELIFDECKELPRDDLLGFTIYHDDVDVAKYLIEQAQKQNPKCNILNLSLRASVRYSSIATMQYLIEAGANINEKTKDGETPLIIAAEWGRIAPIILLEKMGADKDAKNSKGQTYFEYLKEKKPRLYRELKTIKDNL